MSKECNCTNGQSVGCRTYCCRLIVRLTPQEQQYFYPEPNSPHSLPKDADGYCTYLDRENSQCKIWEHRPQACREFNCNEDHKLQFVLRYGEINIVSLAMMAARKTIPQYKWIEV